MQTEVPLFALLIDDVNVRKTGRGVSEPAFVSSIAAKGIIEPLTVRPHNDLFSVINGGKRLAALQWMREKGMTAAGVTVDDDYPVPVTVRQEDDREARDTSLITNAIRAGMHPVDEFEAFAELAAEGMSIADIASRYALEEKQVRQRLALGGLAPVIREAWRKEEIRGEDARAFTLLRDVGEQAKLYARLKKEKRLYSHNIRREIAGDTREAERLFALVGEKAYAKAGGSIVSDLFTDTVIVSDFPLLKRLADEKVAAKLAALRKEGWSWVDVADNIPNRWSLDQIRKKKAEFTDEDKARSGCSVSIGHGGQIDVQYGLLSAAETRKKKAAEARGQREEKGLPAESIPKALAHRLSVALTTAAAEAVTSSPSVALAAMIATFGDGVYGDSPVKLRNDAKGHFHERRFSGAGVDDDDMPVDGEDEPEEEEQEDATFNGRRREEFSRLFEAALKLSLEEQVAMVAKIVARAFDFQNFSGGSPLHDQTGVAQVCAAIPAPAMKEALWKQFDAPDYFGGVSGALRAKAAKEAVGEEMGAKVGRMKKAEAIAWCIANVVPTGWLPPELRTAGYDGPGARRWSRARRVWRKSPPSAPVEAPMSDLTDLKRRVEEATEHVRFLRAAGGASSGYTADLIEELAARADAAETRVKVLEEQVSALKGAAVGLHGLLSLVKNAHAKHREPRLEMPSDKMFEHMIADNEARIERVRAALASKEEGGR